MADKKKHRSEGLVRAIEAASGVSRLTELINDVVAPKRRLTVQAVSQWVEVPPERCIEVELAVGVPRYELRPDIYGEAPPPRRPTRRAEARVA